MADKEFFKNLFGKFGDVSETLAKRYGPLYLDRPDTSQTGTPGVRNIGELEDGARELAPEITCGKNQAILLRYVRGYIAGSGEISQEEIWITGKHVDKCKNKKCRRLEYISTWDNRFDSIKMREVFGGEIEGWR
jgi:hypothetical protein